MLNYRLVMIGLLLCLASCTTGGAPEPKASPDQEGSPVLDEQFDAFLDTAYAELEEKQDNLIEKYRLGSFKRWHYEQATEKIQFFDERDHLRLEADYIEIGTFSPVSSTWMWAWSNTSNLPAIRQKAERLRELEGITGLAAFGADHAFKVEDEAMAWSLVAMSVKHLKALGGYRAPASKEGGPTLYLALTAIRTVPEDSPQ